MGVDGRVHEIEIARAIGMGLDEQAVKTVQENSVLYGTRARQKIIERFQESHMVEETLNVYRKLLAHV